MLDQGQAKFIDLGNCTELYDLNGEHYQDQKEKKFKGNIVLASINVMKYGRPSRKDDLESLCYLLLSVQKDEEISIMFDASNLSQLDHFKKVLEIKKATSVEEHCGSPKTKKFLPFLKEVWGLNYDEKPNYNKLKFMLVSILLD